MALPVIEIDGTDVVDADEVADRSVSIRRRSLDLTLINPSTFPSVGDTVTCDAPAWTGTINRLQTREWADALYVQVTATNLSNLTTSSAPFGLSDTPNDSTTFGYRDLEITHAAGETETEITGTVETFTSGLGPGMFVPITSVLHGYSAEMFYIRDVEVRWQTKDGTVYTLTIAKPMSSAEDPEDPTADGDLPDDTNLGNVIRDIAEDVVDDSPCGGCGSPFNGDGEPETGQQVLNEFVAVGNGSDDDWTTDYPYSPGSLRVWVDGVNVTSSATEDDPGTGAFSLDFAPTTGEVVRVSYAGE